MVALVENPMTKPEPDTESPADLLRRLLGGLVDTAYLCRLFNRSDLTILKWRRERGLPFIRIPGEARDTIRYDKAEVREWAVRNKVRVYPVDRPEPRRVEGADN